MLNDPHLSRFLARVRPLSDGCYAYDGAHTSAGYSETWDGARPLLGHRVMWALRHGVLPDPVMTIDHLCANRGCVNPDHLEQVSQATNNARAYDRQAPGVHSRKTHCPHGHPYDAENTYAHSGARRCKSCNNERRRKRRAARVAQGLLAGN